jgi:hypothetical protein
MAPGLVLFLAGVALAAGLAVVLPAVAARAGRSRPK